MRLIRLLSPSRVLLSSTCTRHTLRSTTTSSTRSFSVSPSPSVSRTLTLGFVGLGHMGSKMVTNFARDVDNSGETQRELLIFDPNTDNQNRLLDSLSVSSSTTTTTTNAQRVRVRGASSVEEVGAKADIVFTMLPNDEIVQAVSSQLLAGKASSASSSSFLHVSCSTISPNMSRALEKVHQAAGQSFVAGPVFARPDGLLRREAIFMVSGEKASREVAASLLSSLGRIEDMGDEIGAANVVKLCGNFLIAASIESIGESMALAEKNGVDRERVMKLLSSSIFDCLIYRGYGQRVSQRDHRPGGFSLELGYKDVSLVNKAARDASVPMPFLSTLVDRYTSAKAKGRGSFDWSAIGLNIAEDAGIDVQADVERTIKDIKDNNLY